MCPSCGREGAGGAVGVVREAEQFCCLGVLDCGGGGALCVQNE